MDALKAIDGNSFLRYFSQTSTFSLGTKSTKYKIIVSQTYSHKEGNSCKIQERPLAETQESPAETARGVLPTV